MSKLLLITLLNSLIIITEGGTSYAQKPPQNIQQDAVEEKTSIQPEVPKQIINITLNNDRLSVDLVNASLEETLRSIAQKAGFSIEGSSRAFNQKMTTKFNDLEVDIGIMRLFSLVKEINYLFNYDARGSISKLKVYDAEAVDSIPASSSPATETGAVPFKTWRSRRLRNSQQPAVPSPSPPPVPQESQPEPTDEEEGKNPSEEDQAPPEVLK